MASSPGTLGALGPFVARQTEGRFANLDKALRTAIQKPKDADAIHDLRVAIRRAVECLRTFEQFFDAKEAKFVKKRIKKLADRCGAVRNCDIALDLLKEVQLHKSKAAASLRTRRRETQKDLTRTLQQLRNGNPLPPHPPVQEGGAGMWDATKDVSSNAAHILPRLFSDLLKAGRKATAPRAHHDTLHGFRLLTKRFRYTLELFQPAYGAEIKKGLTLLSDLQTMLGGINDCVTARELIKGHARAERAVQQLLTRRKSELRAFRRLRLGSGPEAQWKSWLRSPR